MGKQNNKVVKKLIPTMSKEELLLELGELEILVLQRLVELSRIKGGVEKIKNDFYFGMMKKFL